MSGRLRKTTRRKGIVRDAPPIQVRLSREERAGLEEKATAAGMSLGDLVRSCICRAQVVNREDWRRIAFLFSNLTNNLNQLARWANVHKDCAEALAVVVQLRSLEELARQILELPEKSKSTEEQRP